MINIRISHIHHIYIYIYMYTYIDDIQHASVYLVPFARC